MPPKPAVSEQTSAVDRSKPAKIAYASEKEARAVSEALRAKWAKMKSTWWELGAEVRKALDRQVPNALGMNVLQWLTECFDESAAKIYRAVRIVTALRGVPEETVKQLSEGNAYQLTRLPEKERVSEEWLGRALGSSNEGFGRCVDAFIETKTGMKTERRVIMSVSLEEDLEKLWREAERKIADIIELDIVVHPGLRARVFEAVTGLILNTPIEVLRAEIMGATPPKAEPVGDEEGEEKG